MAVKNEEIELETCNRSRPQNAAFGAVRLSTTASRNRLGRCFRHLLWLRSRSMPNNVTKDGNAKDPRGETPLERSSITT